MNAKTEVEWTRLLEEAVTKPGTISKAFTLFHDYSIGNAVAVMLQCHMRGIEPGPIAGYKKWQSLGRQVKGGETALGIFFPIKFKVKEIDDDGNEKEVERMRFEWKHRVFVLDQTVGDEFVMPAVPGFETAHVLAHFGLSMTKFDIVDGNVQGYANHKNEIAINPIAAHGFKTWVHEVAHHALKHTSDECELDRQTRELEAEGVALIVGEVLSLDGQDESRAYIQHWWGQGNAVPETSARRIFSAAEAILKAAKVQVETGE